MAQFERDYYNIYNENKDIVSCEWTNYLFVEYLDPALIKKLEDKYKALGGLEKGRVTYLKIDIDNIFNMGDFVT